MSTTIKIIVVVVLGVVLFGIAVVGVGVYWFSQHSGEYVEEGKRHYEEGLRFGRESDNAGCVSESLARYKRDKGFGTAITTNLFLRACLVASQPTPNFCDDVPKRNEFMKTVNWQLKRCTQAELAGDRYCGQLFQQVQEYCETRSIQPGN